MFKLLYKKVKYRALTSLKEPFIYAYSAHVTNEIIANTQKYGFKGCMTSPLQVDDAKQVIKLYVDKFVENYIDDKFKSNLDIEDEFRQFLNDYQDIESINSCTNYI